MVYQRRIGQGTNLMKKRVIYYQDELNDEFSTAQITPKRIDGSFPYDQNTLSRKVGHVIWYRLLARPIGYLYLKVVYGHQIKNKDVLKKAKGQGFFIYGNHTNAGADALIPSMVSYPVDTYVIVHPNNVSMPVLGKITPCLGAVPLPDSVDATRNFTRTIKDVIGHKKSVMIYPEAHIWPYYTKIRPFTDASFRYPVQTQVPVFALTNTYQKRRFFGTVKIVTYMDGPFYADSSCTAREQKQQLRDQVYQAMIARSKNNTVEKIQYIKMGQEND